MIAFGLFWHGPKDHFVALVPWWKRVTHHYHISLSRPITITKNHHLASLASQFDKKMPMPSSKKKMAINFWSWNCASSSKHFHSSIDELDTISVVLEGSSHMRWRRLWSIFNEKTVIDIGSRGVKMLFNLAYPSEKKQQKCKHCWVDGSHSWKTDLTKNYCWRCGCRLKCADVKFFSEFQPWIPNLSGCLEICKLFQLWKGHQQWCRPIQKRAASFNQPPQQDWISIGSCSSSCTFIQRKKKWRAKLRPSLDSPDEKKCVILIFKWVEDFFCFGFNP